MWDSQSVLLRLRRPPRARRQLRQAHSRLLRRRSRLGQSGRLTARPWRHREGLRLIRGQRPVVQCRLLSHFLPRAPFREGPPRPGRIRLRLGSRTRLRTPPQTLIPWPSRQPRSPLRLPHFRVGQPAHPTALHWRRRGELHLIRGQRRVVHCRLVSHSLPRAQFREPPLRPGRMRSRLRSRTRLRTLPPIPIR